MSSQTTVSRLIGKRLVIPTLPEVVLRINELIENPEAGTREVGELVSQDAPLATKVLRIANSAYYGLAQECVSTNHACTVLGMRVLRSIVTQVAVMDAFSHVEGTESFNVLSLWEHSIRTARVCSHIAVKMENSPRLSADEYYVCGLLHDVGKIVMLESFGASYVSTVKVAIEHNLPLNIVEMRTFKFDHTTVGALLARQWGLPDAVIDAIQYHHGPSERIARDPVVAVVASANILTHSVDEGHLAAASATIDADTRALLGLTLDDVNSVIEFARESQDVNL